MVSLSRSSHESIPTHPRGPGPVREREPRDLRSGAEEPGGDPLHQRRPGPPGRRAARGRGSTDDKGPAVTAFFGALAARRAGVPLNIHFLWETEEEIGSPSFEGGLNHHKGRFRTDALVVRDTVWITRGKPSP